jgi:hypothetical protein
VLLARVNELDALVAAWVGAGRRRQDQATRSRSMGALRARLGRAGGRPNQHGGCARTVSTRPLPSFACGG